MSKTIEIKVRPTAAPRDYKLKAKPGEVIDVQRIGPLVVRFILDPEWQKDGEPKPNE